MTKNGFVRDMRFLFIRSLIFLGKIFLRKIVDVMNMLRASSTLPLLCKIDF